ncbi:MAG TPA: hypothetical protein VMH86_01575 [Rhizomicrobium sp.]|nr:hypothetical protein [Rhizomicrobium sp.]
MNTVRQSKSTGDRVLFFVIVVAGIVGAILLKTFLTNSARIIWPIAFDLALQLIYAYCVLAIPRFWLREDRAGDSFYYAGLLLTLGSLSHTLWQFGASASSDSIAVISGFGLALATTILGLILRVLVQQFRSDPYEIEFQARNALVEASSRLTHDLYRIVDEMRGFRQSIKQITEESIKGTADSAIHAMDETATKFSSEIETLVRNLNSTFESFKGHAQNFADVSGQTAEALEKLAKRIERIEPPANVVEYVFGPARDHMVKMAETLTAAAGGQKQQIERLGELVTITVNAFGGLSKAVASMEEGAARSSELLRRSGEIEEKNAAISAQLSQITASLAENAKAQSGITESMDGLIRTAVSKLSTELDRLSNAEEGATDRIRKTFNELAEISSRHLNDLDDQLAQTRSASRKLVEEVVSLANLIADKLA